MMNKRCLYQGKRVVSMVLKGGLLIGLRLIDFRSRFGFDKDGKNYLGR